MFDARSHFFFPIQLFKLMFPHINNQKTKSSIVSGTNDGVVFDLLETAIWMAFSASVVPASLSLYHKFAVNMNEIGIHVSDPEITATCMSELFREALIEERFDAKLKLSRLSQMQTALTKTSSRAIESFRFVTIVIPFWFAYAFFADRATDVNGIIFESTTIRTVFRVVVIMTILLSTVSTVAVMGLCVMFLKFTLAIIGAKSMFGVRSSLKIRRTLVLLFATMSANYNLAENATMILLTPLSIMIPTTKKVFEPHFLSNFYKRFQRSKHFRTTRTTNQDLIVLQSTLS